MLFEMIRFHNPKQTKGHTRAIVVMILLSLLSCTQRNETAQNSCYKESRLSFYNPFNDDYTIQEWIRKPENIRTLHETFKKYGYSRIFTEDDLTSNPCIIWSYVNKPCATLIDSLILTYPVNPKSPKYYREFWARRIAEKNDTTVYAVLVEVRDALINKRSLRFDERLANDTIYNLLRIKLKKPDNEEEATTNFNYLTMVELHQSAYNMLFEATWYDELKWNRDKLKENLTVDTAYCAASPIIVDDTK